MLNLVALEGIIVRTWKADSDFLFRMACFRDPWVPPKPDGPVRDSTDSVTVRIGEEMSGFPGGLAANDRVRVHGHIRSRGYTESLADFARETRGAARELLEAADPRRIVRNRVATEISAVHILRLNGHGIHAS